MESHNENESTVVLFLDYDGTLTKTKGSKLVFSSFYESLFTAPLQGLTNNLYESGIFKDNAIELIKAKLFNTHPLRDDRRLTKEAVNFLNGMLPKKNIFLFIISYNSGDYIETMLTLEGFSFEKIGIFSSKDGFCGYTSDPRIEKKLTAKVNNQTHNKKQMVEFHLDTLIEMAMEDAKSENEAIEKLKKYQFYTFDDDVNNIAAMNSAINQKKFDQYSFPDHYVSYRKNPGQFKWDEYKEEILAQFKPRNIPSICDMGMYSYSISTIMNNDESLSAFLGSSLDI